MAEQTYTVAIRCHRPGRTYVFLKVFPGDAEVIEYAKGEIADPRNNVSFILLRRGDAKPTDPVFWDSRNGYR